MQTFFAFCWPYTRLGQLRNISRFFWKTREMFKLANALLGTPITPYHLIDARVINSYGLGLYIIGCQRAGFGF